MNKLVRVLVYFIYKGFSRFNKIFNGELDKPEMYFGMYLLLSDKVQVVR